MKTKHTAHITREIEIEIEYRYHPHRNATHTDPPEFASVDICTATLDTGEEIALTNAEIDALTQDILNSPPERDHDY
jgi:hypothetical protein